MPSATRNLFEKRFLDFQKLLIIKNFGESKTLFIKRVLAAGGRTGIIFIFGS